MEFPRGYLNSNFLKAVVVGLTTTAVLTGSAATADARYNGSYRSDWSRRATAMAKANAMDAKCDSNFARDAARLEGRENISPRERTAQEELMRANYEYCLAKSEEYRVGSGGAGIAVHIDLGRIIFGSRR